MITILGPTATGKTQLAAELAANIDAEIISADSRQVYRRMDIGTGKDLGDYVVQGKCVPYHLIDICEPGTRYNVYEYQKDFIDAYNDITTRGKKVVLCGGTGLYLEAVLRGYRLSPVPQNDNLRQRLEGKALEELTTILEELKRKNGTIMHNRTDVDTAQRAIRAIEIEEYYLEHPVPDRAFPKINSVVIGVDIDREERRKRITRRLKQRLEEGMIEEVKGLIDSGIPPENLIYYGLEYKYVTEHLMGKTTYQEMFKLLEIAIHQFAKRQMTWFRGMEKRGVNIHWLQASLPMSQKVETIKMLAKDNLTQTE
ncbi:MAG: tRNA (adenosine(37)-N6)-dimethylallyltransferase MiaA [Prevotella sp.]|nr:tRNA (adenosine(37)-N6)-dimethylallyltransferase MiaA [Prevotella sp.]